jgi:hypothetical protein
MVGSLHLTDENVAQIVTLPGQAHFAIDGRHTCRECAHWASKGQRDPKGNLKPAHCRKARLMSPEPLPEIPYRAWACKHFEASPTPPAI